MAAPVEKKVQASTAAAALSGLALWALGRYVFRNSAVPDVVVSWVYVLVPGILAFAAGYLAKHTGRPAVPVPPALMGLISPVAYSAGGIITQSPPAAPEPPPAASGVPPVPSG